MGWALSSHGWYMTRRLTRLYGSQRSIRMFGGLGGIWGRRSMITLRGGGGHCLPLIVIILRPMLAVGGGGGGRSRIMTGEGVRGLCGCWRMTRGGGRGARWASCSLFFKEKKIIFYKTPTCEQFEKVSIRWETNFYDKNTYLGLRKKILKFAKSHVHRIMGGLQRPIIR